MNRIDPLNELEQDHDVRTAIADVEAVKRREAELRNKTRLRRFKDTLIEWGRFSSYNGMSHFALADNRYTLTFWFLIVTSSFVAFVYLLYITMRQYLEYRTDIDINLVYDRTPFPAITICNASPYKASKARSNPRLQALLNWFEHIIATNGAL